MIVCVEAVLGVEVVCNDRKVCPCHEVEKEVVIRVAGSTIVRELVTVA